MRQSLQNVIAKANISRVICDHLLDEKHTDHHRMAVGGVIIFIGVAISKIHVEFTIIHFLLDSIGYAVHGVGLTPFIEKAQKSFNKTAQ